MDIFLTPKSVAIIGASTNPMKFGSIIMANLFNIGYEGKIFPVNQKAEPIAGLTTYRSVIEIPEPVDLAIFAIPASGALEAMRDCAAKGVKGVVIISSGFTEAGEEGERRQQELLDVAQVAGIRVIGPNTTGILNPIDRFTTTFVPLQEVKAGPVAFIAQTGMFAGMLLEWILSSECFGISRVIGLGNKCDVDDADALEYLADDEHTKAIMMYIEAIKDGRRFMDAARAAALKKPVFALKSGETGEGARAAMSHTGSMAGNDAITSAAFKQAGIIRVDCFQKLIDYAKMLAYQPVAKGNRLAIVSLSGGAAVMSTDAAMKAGFQLAHFSNEILAEIQKEYPLWATVRHPFDIEPLTETVGFMPAFKKTVRCALSNPDTQVCLIVTWTPFAGMGYSFEFIKEMQEEYPGKPVAFCSIGYKNNHEALFQQLEAKQIPVYSSFTRAIDALAASVEYGKFLASIRQAKLEERRFLRSERPKTKPAAGPKKPDSRERHEKVTVFFDGASRGNPGPAAIGIVVKNQNGETLSEVSEAIGKATNNYAEYTALIRALEEARRLGATEVKCLSDSELVVRQMKGEYGIKSKSLLPLVSEAQALRRTFHRFGIRHIPREQNKRADQLAGLALKKQN
ncbi:MAG: reverse transcriptase-like protein [Candidatus Abyssobacteria bacterium SURF_5]|uniref:Reverse transcriptase-like protein n=1 Tax=Abyssobacteria bacterium (strain SURF_5) TaxID=2093360 RepID=A0A3A4NTK6_ABYX5|nr:MAG: reverse transcriptase-like protein [Candidatus Abyssubacteria bacterium SURF_5]